MRDLSDELRDWASSSQSNFQIGSRTIRMVQDAADLIDRLRGQLSGDFTITLAGEARDCLVNMLGCIGQGWAVTVTTEGETFTALYGGVDGAELVVQPADFDFCGQPGAPGPERRIELSALDAIHVH